MGGHVAPARHQRQRPGPDQRHDAAESHHDLEGDVDHGHRRPVRPREGVEALDRRAGVMKGEQREALRDLEGVAGLARPLIRPSADSERRAHLGPELPLHGRQFGRLPARHDAGAQIARQGLDEGGRRAYQQRHRHGSTMECMTGVAQQVECMDAGHDEARGRVGRERHMQGLGERGRVEHRRDRVDVDRPAVYEVKAGRRVHPGIGDHHEDARQPAAHRHEPAGREMGTRRDAIPAVEVDAEEDRFGEEGEPLQ